MYLEIGFKSGLIVGVRPCTAGETHALHDPDYFGANPFVVTIDGVPTIYCPSRKRARQVAFVKARTLELRRCDSIERVWK